MILPDEFIINFIKDFCICHFKDTNHVPKAPPHYYVNVPVNDDSSLLLCIITSQIEKRKNYYSRNEKALKALVYVSDKTLPFLSKESVIDCNGAELYNRIELQRRIDPKHKIQVTERNIPDSLKTQITKAVQDSPLIKRYIKKLLKN